MIQENIQEKFEYKTYMPSSEDDWLDTRDKFISATNTMFALQNFCAHPGIRQFAVEHEKDEYKKTKWYFFTKKTLTREQKEALDQLESVEKPALRVAAKFGKEHEAEVAQEGFGMLQELDEFAGAELVANGELIHYLENHHCSATPDYIVKKANGERVLLECKTCGMMKQEAVDKLIEKYSIQVATQMLCTGIKEAYIVRGTRDGEFSKITNCKLHKIEYKPVLEKYILQASDACWQWLQDCINGKCECRPAMDVDGIHYANRDDGLLAEAISVAEQQQKQRQKQKDLNDLLMRRDNGATPQAVETSKFDELLNLFENCKKTLDN